jgi:hypothetical protein
LHRKEDVVCKRAAKNWVADTNLGLVSFSECCECLDIDMDKAAAALKSFAVNDSTKPISRVVFGVTCNA